jgi:hypothetical protein
MEPLTTDEIVQRVRFCPAPYLERHPAKRIAGTRRDGVYPIL